MLRESVRKRQLLSSTIEADAARVSTPSSARHWLSAARVPLLVGLAYYLGAQFAFLIGTLSDQVFALFWPPNVILFCALLFRPRREWLTLIAAAFVAHVAAEVGVGMAVPQLLVAFATNCLVALLNAYAVRRLLDPPPWLGTFRRMGTYILITAGISPAFAALGGAFVPILGGGSIQDYWVFWSLWYLGNALPSVTLGPVLLIWLTEPPLWRSWKAPFQVLEPAAIAIALIAIGLLSTELEGMSTLHIFSPAIALLPLPLILYASIRYGEKGASGTILVIATTLTWCTLRGRGMFAGQDREMSVLALQLFLTGLSIPILLLGAMVEEVRNAGQMTRTLGASLVRAQDEERRRNARDLDREATLEEAQRIAHLGYWDHDLQTDLRTWSDETYRILGLAPQERTITSAVWQDLVHPEDRRMVNEALAEALRGGPRYDVDYRMVRPDGAVRVVHSKGDVTRDESGRPCRIFGTVQDITERKRAEEDLRESERRYREAQMELAHANRVATVGQLSAAIAHELNQPLGAILSNIETAELMLGSPTPNLEELKTILADVRRADVRASEIIEHLRRLLTKSDFDAREIDLNEIAREVLGIMAVQASGNTTLL